MYEYLSTVIAKAEEDTKVCLEKYETQRQENAINMKEEMSKELKRMTNDDTLSKYSPTEHHNKMTIYQKQYEILNTNEKKEIEAIKKELYSNLCYLMNDNESTKKYDVSISQISSMKEMYKIINKCNTEGGNPNLICRVWFTLVAVTNKYNPGDPIRVEWIKLDGKARDNDTTCSIVTQSIKQSDGTLKIPDFYCDNQIMSAPNLYNENYWGEKSPQRERWNKWVSKNRPC